MRFSIFAVLALILALAACDYGGSNPGGHSPEEISRAEKQGPPPAPKPAPSTAAADTGNYDGARLYNQYCAVCHSEGKNGPSLVGVFQRRELPSGTPANDVRVKETIMMGRAMMPAFQGTLNEAQVSAIVQYLHTM